MTPQPTLPLGVCPALHLGLLLCMCEMNSWVDGPVNVEENEEVMREGEENKGRTKEGERRRVVQKQEKKEKTGCYEDMEEQAVTSVNKQGCGVV